MASLLPACEPPLITFIAGTGKITSFTPANSAIYLYNGIHLCAAPALHTANETPKSALAPNFAKITFYFL